MSDNDKNEVQCFNRGEKVLCYEPDPAKAKVLYDSKILGVYESKDKTGKKYYEYKVHFQGWNSSWDRKVRANFLLKDNEENRNLQRELAEKEQLQIGGYLYKAPITNTTANTSRRKQERNPKKRKTGVVGQTDSEIITGDGTEGQNTTTGRSRESRAGSGGRANKQADSSKEKNKIQPGSSTDHHHHQYNLDQGNRVMLRISERLRKHLEYDHDMVVNQGRQHKLPVNKPIVDLLEDFIRLRAVELACSIEANPRQRNTQQYAKKLEAEYDRVMTEVSLCKEVVDSLRIYFEFSLEPCLLYEKEVKHTQYYITKDYVSSFERKPPSTPWIGGDETKAPDPNDDLFKFGTVEYNAQLKYYLNIMENNTRSNKSSFAASVKITKSMHAYLLETFSWQLLPGNAEPEKSMIFGATHLARLMVKLPEFLSVSPLNEKKLKTIIPHLDSFIYYLESNKDLFGEHNYLPSTEKNEQIEISKEEVKETPKEGHEKMQHEMDEWLKMHNLQRNEEAIALS